ncbi:hypothetical protein IV38_GL000347 [Lactobacillus selangorensis]|uniref:Galactose mutarotase-like protein n=1 Tax=Lactobacillus selangorensis TaxID=81857 RepID=A0A0R2G0I1_9LACO|nr:aldose 1-epimerase family protein [Lactobacillus selangorensis]KRN29463.1 hypothetical protein IV38_GL000347 [Lactobacillus selangorensis]KRN34008.1 hypothetical protein IV40_GL000321 [Lactobacillus selangorensis]
MTVKIENSFLTATFVNKGAELQSLTDNHSGIEYIWQGDPKIWGRHAPVLFPFVGRLKDDQYTYQGKTYHMGQHGFARDRDFVVEEQTPASVTFRLDSDAESKQNYPFDFILRIQYSLEDSSLKVHYDVTNPSTNEPLYFSIGGHPGFRIPQTDDLTFEDYYLSFDPKKSRIRIPLDAPLTDYAHRTLAATDTDIDLTHDLFDQDAIIYTGNAKDNFSLRSDKSEHFVQLTVKGEPFTGVWSPYPTTGNLVCIEPWWGIADDVTASGELTEKRGINKLDPGQDFKRSFRITVG